MGDTFTLLATAISSITSSENGLWLISQLYVLVSRVKYLNQLFFIGSKEDTLIAIDALLRKRNLNEERLYKLFYL